MAEQNQEPENNKSAADPRGVAERATADQPKASNAAKASDAAKADDAKGASKPDDAIAQLKSDHRKVEQLFESYEKATRRAQKQTIAQQICLELIIHTTLEEEIFYPACREHVEHAMLDEAQVEHDGAKVLINELLAGRVDQPYFDAKVKVLSEMIKHHVNEEEKRAEGIFAKAKSGGVDVDEIAQRFAARKAEFLAQAEQNGPERPRPRSFSNQEDTPMAQGQYRDRDQRGRFTNDDNDDRRYATSRSRGGSRYEDDGDNRRSSSRVGRGYEDEDDDRRYASSRSGGAGATTMTATIAAAAARQSAMSVVAS